MPVVTVPPPPSTLPTRASYSVPTACPIFLSLGVKTFPFLQLWATTGEIGTSHLPQAANSFHYRIHLSGFFDSGLSPMLSNPVVDVCGFCMYAVGDFFRPALLPGTVIIGGGCSTSDLLE